MTGFSNERTSEYMICNDLYNRIKNKYSFFIHFIIAVKGMIQIYHYLMILAICI